MFPYKDSLGLFVIEDLLRKQNLLSLLLLQLVQGWPIFSVKCLYYNTLTQIWHAVLYLQSMSNLPTQHLDVQQHFNCLWACLSSDLVIKQALIRSLKTSGGLTQGHGKIENSAYCGCCQGLPVQKLIRQCRSSLGLTTTPGSRIRIWQ